VKSWPGVEVLVLVLVLVLVFVVVVGRFVGLWSVVVLLLALFRWAVAVAVLEGRWWVSGGDCVVQRDRDGSMSINAWRVQRVAVAMVFQCVVIAS